MARVEFALAAIDDLAALERSHSLPPDTRKRVARSLRPLQEFPLLGAALHGRWDGLRFVLGPWRWMLLVYEYFEDDNRVVIVTVQDARSSSAVTSGR